MVNNQSILAVILVFCFASISGVKVKERIKNVPDHEFVVGVPCLGHGDAMNLAAGGTSMSFLISSFMPGLNCSTICLDSVAIDGVPYPNGTFSGIIREVQSNRTNTVSGFFPYGSIEGEPAILVPSPILLYNPHIYSAEVKGHDRSGLTVIHMVDNFSLDIWCYWLVVSMICSISCLILKYSINVSSTIGIDTSSTIGIDNCKKFVVIKQFFESYWNYFMLSVDMAPSMVPIMTASATLWTVICIGVYYGIHMVFMSTLSADLTIHLPPKWIDRVDDLLDGRTGKTWLPAISPQLMSYRVFSEARIGSRERELFNWSIQTNSILDAKIVAHNLDIIRTADFLTDTLARLSNHEIAIIEDSVFMDTIFQQLMCHLDAEKTIGIKKSIEGIYSTPTAMLLSHATHPHDVNLFRYRILNTIEFGQVKGFIAVRAETFLDSFNIKRTIGGYQRVEKLQLKLQPEFESGDWNRLPMKFLLNFIYICSGFVSLSCILLWYEIVYYQLRYNIVKPNWGKAILIVDSSRLMNENLFQDEDLDAQIQRRVEAFCSRT